MRFSLQTNAQKRLFWGSLGLVTLAFFAWLLLKITLQYIPIQDDVAFLRIKQAYIEIKHWKIAFFVHVFTSMFALVAGFTQFSRYLLRQYKPLHRWMGRVYVLNILAFTGPSGLIMSFYANGGWTSRMAFILLSLSWLGTTFMAYQTVRAGNFVAHRHWMYRSYALTLSAVTLRAWKWVLVLLFEPRPMDVYRLVAWLGFIPNLLLAEWLIRRHQKRKQST